MNAKLIGLICCSDQEVIAVTTMELYEMGYTVITDDTNYVFGIPGGDVITPVMYMAHIDTVRKSNDVLPAVFQDTLFNENGVVCGALGADDRAGVYIVLEIIKQLEHKPYVLFTTGEERGHTGVQVFLNAPHPERASVPEEFYLGKTLIEPYLPDIYCILQYDRRGMHDVVAYGAARAQDDLINKAIVLGYKYEIGSTSDCRNITERHNVSHLNLSAGFLHEHTPEEILILPALDFAIRNGVTLASMIDRPFRIERPDYFSAWPTFKKEVTFNHYPPRPEDKPLPKNMGMTPTCDVCGKHRKVTYFFESNSMLCKKCINRIGKNPITMDEVRWQKVRLGYLQSKSKSSNLPFTPSCPVCKGNKEVIMLAEKSRHGVMFCDECGTYFWQTKQGVYFWDILDAATAEFYYFHSPDKTYKVNVDDGLCPLTNCEICGHLLPDVNVAYYHNEDTGEVNLVVCDECNVIDKPTRRK